MDANQARRRTDLDSVSTHDTGLKSQPTNASKYEYQPLDPDTEADSIRLVLIQPSTHHDDTLACSLSHVKFAERPKYKALSYMWGDEAAKQDILLDGAKFQVRQNLWDALHYLRTSGNHMPFWIDAICINQDDVDERNRQLAIMPHIYFRADTVFIWLGKKYSKYQMPKQGGSAQVSKDPSTISEGTAETGEVSADSVVKRDSNERAMATELCSDGYWNRLWIIQEIGKARDRKVCFGTLAMEWDQFIVMATLHNSNSDGPLRLNRLVHEKYDGSHTLRKLLQDHRQALCKEPRDKIYGLIGLAADAYQFPMDYTKSLIEVWTDTMVFVNRWGLLLEPDIISFGALVKSLLIGDNLAPLQQALRPHDPRPDSTLIVKDPKSPLVFQLRAFVVGCILEVGPSTDEIISSTRKADDWASKLQYHFRHELGRAHHENDELMRAILEFSETRVASMCFSHVSNVRWEECLPYNNYSRNSKSYEEVIQEYKSKYAPSLVSAAQKATNDPRPSNISSSYLFLLKNCNQHETPWKMGIASSLAEPGDLVCWVDGVKKALILRVINLPLNKPATIQVFGTALFTDDFDSNDNSQPANRLSWFKEGENINIQMDATTIYVLLA